MDNSSIAKDFATRIREIRRRKGWNLEVAANKCGVNNSFLQKIETARQIPSIDTAAKIAAGYGVPLTDLFAFDENAKEVKARLKQMIDGVPDKEIARVARVLEAALH